jgi:hypothetical protein
MKTPVSCGSGAFLVIQRCSSGAPCDHQSSDSWKVLVKILKIDFWSGLGPGRALISSYQRGRSSLHTERQTQGIGSLYAFTRKRESHLNNALTTCRFPRSMIKSTDYQGGRNVRLDRDCLSELRRETAYNCYRNRTKPCSTTFIRVKELARS